MTDDTEDVDPEHPRPAGHYGRFRGAPWYYVSDDLASTVMLGPATDAEPGDDWILSFSAEGRTEEDRERVCVRLTPRALHELYIEAKDLSPDARQAGHTAECDLCGESVPLEKAVPNPRGEPVHRRCYVDAYGGPEWLKDY
jgi:hypothetical protein